MGLPSNSEECIRLSTNKQAMRMAFADGGDPSPRSVAVRVGDDYETLTEVLSYPVIVKPSDRSGSRGITKALRASELQSALYSAWGVSFNGTALVEEFLEGTEFSVECFSWEGKHQVLQITRKYTTGAPHFVETAHVQPSGVDSITEKRIVSVVTHALGSLKVWQGASHAEVKVNARGEPWIVEIGSRMGGDFIGSSLVPLSTGIDYVGAVIDAALGIRPNLIPRHEARAAAVRFVLSSEDYKMVNRLRRDCPELIVEASWDKPVGRKVTDSSMRFGCCVMAADSVDTLTPWLP